ncbi:FtsX-like permease family protein [candidate division KSB1 bacterium]|nr:ABC transporter permease [candidate division KSB1 bacterium]RQW03908.1 MAG: FtsX-like permease family protein [candidate division KSB1 bacterium]
MLFNTLKLAFRSMKKQKSYAIINILGLAVGMATAITIYTWVNNELNYDKFHAQLDRLYRVAFYVKDEMQFANTFHGEWLPGRVADYLRDTYADIDAATIIGEAGAKLSYEDKNFYAHGKFVHPDFLQMFDFPFLSGDVRAFDEGMCAVITQELADKLFGDQDAVGKTVVINDQTQMTVSGVVTNPPRNSSIQFEFLSPYRLAPEYMKMWNNKSVQVFVKLNDQANWQDVGSEIENVYNIHNPNDLPNYLYLQPMSEMRLHKLGGEGGRITFIYIFSVMGIFILIIACINFINLSTARSSARAHEIGVKKVLGSRRSQLFRQFMAESFLSCLFAFVGALLLSELWLPLINRLLRENLQIEFSWMTVLVSLGIILFTGFLGGLYPSLYLSSFRPIITLKGNSLGHSRGPSWSRKSLVILQFSISIIFIIGITVIVGQLYYCQNSDLGYDKENIVVVPLNGEAWSKQLEIKQELLKNANIQSVSISSNGLARWNSSAGIDWPGKQGQVFDVGVNYVDGDFQKTFQLDVAEGRFFSPDYPSDLANACLLNETAIRAMQVENPVGKQIVWCKGTDFERTATIIGVLKDFHTESFHSEIRPYVFFPTEKSSRLNIKIATGNIGRSMRDIRLIMKNIAPHYTFSSFFVDQELLWQYQTEMFTGVLVLYIAGIAIFITILGLIGLASFSAERRTKEIGIRKTLGATKKQIIALITKEFTILVIAANLLGWPIAWYVADKWLQNFAFHISLGWWIFVLAGVITLGLTWMTVSSQAVRAASANPVDTLRYE